MKLKQIFGVSVYIFIKLNYKLQKCYIFIILHAKLRVFSFITHMSYKELVQFKRDFLLRNCPSRGRQPHC
jgi:hypothetical protein